MADRLVGHVVCGSLADDVVDRDARGGSRACKAAISAFAMADLLRFKA
jgi:hypothetical protein